MSEWKKGDLVSYRIGEMDFKAQVYGYVEGWPELLFADGSTAIVRPSQVKPRKSSREVE